MLIILLYLILDYTHIWIIISKLLEIRHYRIDEWHSSMLVFHLWSWTDAHWPSSSSIKILEDVTPWTFWRQKDKSFIHVLKKRERQNMWKEKEKNIQGDQGSAWAFIWGSAFLNVCCQVTSAEITTWRCSSYSFTAWCWVARILASFMTLYVRPSLAGAIPIGEPTSLDAWWSPLISIGSPLIKFEPWQEKF